MAFADDFVLLAETPSELQRALDLSAAFFQRRGMVLNPLKSRVLVRTRVSGSVIPVCSPGLTVGSAPIPPVDKYLGMIFDTSGVMRPCLTNYPAWLQRLLACPLKPQQKINILRTYLLPRLFYGLQNSRISAASLKSVDRVTRHYVKKILHMHLHTQDSFIHAPFREGGLGITELRITIPNVFRSRIRKLAFTLAFREIVLRDVQSWISRLRQRDYSSFFPFAALDGNSTVLGAGAFHGGGLEQATEDPASRAWILEKPRGWSGKGFVHAVQLRTANLPTKAIPSTPKDQRRCR
ncbi:unnamed protein product, partial [Tenebrio molitor]